MDAQKGNIFEILNGTRQFIIPVYQRLYSWGMPQCERLWDDIVAMEKLNKQGHFVGSIVNIAEKAMPTGVQKFMIIDGQQRITTLILMLIALRDVAIQNNDESINPIKIENMLLKNQYEEGLDRYKLLLTENDRDILIDLIESRPPAKDKKSRLIDSYNFFMKKIASKELALDKVYESIGKLQIVNVTLDRIDDDAQAIFESLNSTGKELSESDLIRNFILMGLDTREQTYIYENYWRPLENLFADNFDESLMDSFFRDYLTMKLSRIPSKRNVYEEFKNYYRSSTYDIRGLAENLLTHAGFYTNIIFASHEDIEIKRLYKDIVDLRMEVSYPFLLHINQDLENQKISKDEFKEILRLCISYVLRRSVVGIPTNSLNKTFATMYNYINPDDYLNSVKAFFILQESYKEFPKNLEFTKALATKDLYNTRNRNYILRSLENYDNKSPVIIENCTIEHIMPQNKNLSPEWKEDLGPNWKIIQENYLHTLGNLTLTAYNSEMSDLPFKRKMDMKGGFKESAFRLNRDILGLDSWDEDSIKNRANNLAQIAIEAWPYPKLTDEELKPYVKEETDKKEYSLENYNLSERAKYLYDLIDRRILNLSPDVFKVYNKYYIAYKLDTNFVDIVVYKTKLNLTLNMKFDEIVDSRNICRDITGLGKWGNGNVLVDYTEESDLDYIMGLVKQSFNKQLD